MRKFLSAAAIVFTLSATAQAQDWDKGWDAYEAGDCATAAKEFRLLAEEGNALAQLFLGFMYQFGDGVPQDYKEAASLFRKAAEQGNVDAQFSLGLMYRNGEGVPQDYKEAVNWYRKSAEKGYAGAQTNLGFMYENGQGLLQDNVLAHMWYNIGSANGNETAAENRDKRANVMTAEQIAEAQAMARDCMASNYQNCGY